MDIELKGEPQYFLSQTLAAHSSAVRSLSYKEQTLLSGSSDKLAKLYTFDTNHYELITTMDFYSNYIYAVCHREGGGYAVASGNQIYLHDQEGNPVGVLEGHQGQVCSLSSKSADQLVSGSWDATGIVWDLKNNSIIHKLEGHKYGVAVLATESADEQITGSQDGILRQWINGKEVNKKQAHNDIIREISSVTNIGYLTCSNDESIKLWSKQLDLLSTFLGHSGFVFSTKSFECTGTLYYVSGSDDNTVKVWKGTGDQLQTINHPGCVWSVCVNKQNGDIITGCVDGKIRIFTLNPQRKANQQEIEDYDKEVELAAAQGPEGLSQEQLQKMPSIEELHSIIGKKEGDVKMFRNGNKPEVYAWDGVAWQKLGDVVGGSNKKPFEGDQYFPAGEYDYVFDVEDESGVPKRIPCNDGDNHMDVAERFCKREGFSKSQLTQIITFLRKNTKQVEKKVVTVQQSNFECIPFTQSFFYETMNMVGLQKKIDEFNTELTKESNPFALSYQELHQFSTVSNILSQSISQAPNLEITHINLITGKLLKWPTKYMVPIYDLLRVVHLHHSSEKLYSGLDNGIFIFTEMGVNIQQKDQSTVFIRLCLQTLCNLFKHNTSVYAGLRHMQIVTELVSCSAVMTNTDEKVSQVIANLILNYSIAIYQRPTTQSEAGNYLGQMIIPYIKSRQRDSESLAKISTAVGNLSQCGELSLRKQIKQSVGDLIMNLQIVDDQEAAKCLKEVKTSLSRV